MPLFENYKENQIIDNGSRKCFPVMWVRSPLFCASQWRVDCLSGIYDNVSMFILLLNYNSCCRVNEAYPENLS
jgi:hypothetical protein